MGLRVPSRADRRFSDRVSPVRRRRARHRTLSAAGPWRLREGLVAAGPGTNDEIAPEVKTLKLLTGFLFVLSAAATALTFAVCDPFAEAALSSAQAKARPPKDPEACWRDVRAAFERCGSLIQAERERLEADTRRALDGALKGLILALTGRRDATGATYAELSRCLRLRREEAGLDFLAVLTAEGLVPPEDMELESAPEPFDLGRSFAIEVGRKRLDAYLLPRPSSASRTEVRRPATAGAGGREGSGEASGPGGEAVGSATAGSTQELCLSVAVPVKEEGEVAQTLLLGGRFLDSVSPRLQEGLGDLRRDISWHTFLEQEPEGPVAVLGPYRGRPVRKDLLERLAREPEVESPSVVVGASAQPGKFGRIWSPTREVIGGWGVAARPLEVAARGDFGRALPQFTRVHWLLALGLTLVLGLSYLLLPSGSAAKSLRKAPAGSSAAPASPPQDTPAERLLSELQTSWKAFAYYMNQLVSRTLAEPSAQRSEDADQVRRRLEEVADGLSRLRAEIGHAAERVEGAVESVLGAASAQPRAEESAPDASASSEALLRKLESDVGYLAALLSQAESAGANEPRALERAEGAAPEALVGFQTVPVLEESKATLRSLEQGMREVRRLNQILRDELAKSRQREDRLRLDLAETEARAAALTAEMEKESSKQREALQAKEESARREGEISVSWKAAEKLRAEAEAEAERLRSSCEALKAELERSGAEAASQAQELEEWRVRARSWDEERRRLEEEARNAAQADAGPAPLRDEAVNRELEELRSERARLEEVLQEVCARAEEDAAHLRKLEAELAAERARVNRSEQEARNLAARLAAQQMASDAIRREKERLESERACLAQELETAARRREEELRERSEEVSRLRLELEKARAEAGAAASPAPASPEEQGFAVEARCRALFEESFERSFPAALVVLDGEDRVVAWSRVAAELFALGEEETIGKSFFELQTPLAKEAFRRRFDENKRDGAAHAFRVRLPSAGAAESYVVTQAPLRGEDGGCRGHLLLLQPASLFQRGEST